MKYNQNFRKKKSLVFLRNLKLPYFFSTGKSKRKTAPLLPQNGVLLFVRVFKNFSPCYLDSRQHITMQAG